MITEKDVDFLSIKIGTSVASQSNHFICLFSGPFIDSFVLEEIYDYDPKLVFVGETSGYIVFRKD